jgi:acetylornithine deacetylase/succinyl-diaminopimelate desuccinylase-like protein
VRSGARVLGRIPVFDAVLRAGISAALVNGGIRSNVIPTDATATLNVRTLPGQSLESVLGRLRKAIGDPLVTLEITSRGDDAPASDFESPMFRAIRDSACEVDPSLLVVPYLSTGATDSAQLRAWGMQAFGVLPFPLTQEDEDRMHGNDERVPVSALGFGTRLIYGAIARVARQESE